MSSIPIATAFNGLALAMLPSASSAPMQPGAVLAQLRLPTDPIGSHTLTLTNVVPGSRVAVRDQAGTTSLYDQIAAASTVVIALPVYAPGSELNDWRIRIRKASASPTYRPFETLATAFVGAQSIYVAQISDE